MEEIEFSRWLFEGRPRQGKNVLPDGLNWLCYSAGSSKSHHENSSSTSNRYKNIVKLCPYGAAVRPEVYHMSVLKCASNLHSNPLATYVKDIKSTFFNLQAQIQSNLLENSNCGREFYISKTFVGSSPTQGTFFFQKSDLKWAFSQNLNHFQ